jgi:hypothetical protein
VVDDDQKIKRATIMSEGTLFSFYSPVLLSTGYFHEEYWWRLGEIYSGVRPLH